MANASEPVPDASRNGDSRSSLEALLRPRTIAVVGASRQTNTIGYHLVANLVNHGFAGAVYAVNPRAKAVHSMPAWPSIASIPEPVDCAVISVPREHVLAVAEECGQHGVRGLVVISAGFREVGGAGVDREQQLMDVVRRYRMRMVGPNCMGIINTDPALRMNATFVPVMPPFGRAAFVSQSGALGASVLDYATELGIGIAQFVSMGNKPDVSGNDLLLHWEHDPQIGVILMYVEDFGNPRRFLEIASRITRTKPIIVVKAGRSMVGARAASSHTGALAASDTAVEALLVQSGVLRASSIEELFDMAMAFTVLDPPRGRRTAIVTNSGGPGVLAADALESYGLIVGDFGTKTLSTLAPLFPAEASIRNPLDMIASANADGYRTALGAVLDDDAIDAAVTIFTPPLGVRTQEVAEAIGKVAMRHRAKPVLAVLMGREGLPQGKAELLQAGVPSYVFPESAARALAGLTRHGERRGRPPRAPPDAVTLGANVPLANAILSRARETGERKLSELDALALVESFGIRTVGTHLARSATDAAELAANAGWPVVLKIVSSQIAHKTDVGGVRLDLRSEADVRKAYEEILINARQQAPGAEIEGVIVQHQVTGGRELIVGFARQPGFGALVMVGLGGILVEVLRDVTFRISPIDALDAQEMLAGLHGSAILDHLRGQPPVDREKVVDVLVRVARLGADFPEIAELDINPLLVSEHGAMAVDARAMLST